jgi:hypothetical protein
MVLLASEFDKSKYLRAEDLKADKKLRIKDVTVEVIGNGADKEQKLTVWFTNDPRGLVLNKTNNRVLRGAFGDDVSGWKNKIIVVFPTTVEFRGKMVPGLRVRIPAPKQTATSTGNGQAAVTAAAPPAPQPAAPSASQQQPAQQLDEFGQTQSPEKPSLSDDLDDEIGF